MKILFVQHLYFLNGSGGTEKICSFLANGFAKSGHEVIIATNQNSDGKPMFALDKNIVVNNIYDDKVPQKKVKSLYNYKGKNPILWVFFKIKKKYSKLYNTLIRKRMGGDDSVYKYNLLHRSMQWKSYVDRLQPDLIITMSVSSLLEITYQNTINIPIINSVNGRPDYDYSNILGYRSPFEMNLLENSFKELSAIQIMFDSYREFLPKAFRGKCCIISNPVPQTLESELVDHSKSKDTYCIIHVGRLDDGCKQQSIAIDIFSELALHYPNWNLDLWGIGADEQILADRIKRHKLEDRIFLKGFTDTPVEKMKNADIFIFPSKYEGFGLALGEAMSAGLPSLGFQNCSGVNELIEHGKTGYLAENSLHMKQQLEQLIQSAKLRARIGLQAHLAMKKYNPEYIFDSWNNLISDIVIK
ncbi:Probable poly(glycerol-phosphate) alpha-glucosyltransferase [Sphingobacterium spiritivorum]|uniref:Probable poly(Glycerol-phosphate) alpha-glucosyltransferase n=1 Tax=Sphingobacterium spiritivorum TaxID=258 RepID=A0A380B8S8_SPHSI|nr:glycosyltransferase [Sphingobacterium spiritivorum]SUI96869.1 Probable poly(glycerol-phosphate) alpha-glucosyltransferase [Sphingobacterium spiritivorum]